MNNNKTIIRGAISGIIIAVILLIIGVDLLSWTAWVAMVIINFAVAGFEYYIEEFK